jgi:hypothetical protein
LAFFPGGVFSLADEAQAGGIGTWCTFMPSATDV